jgi:hypothetical protein
MMRERSLGEGLWGAVLPRWRCCRRSLRELPAELANVDAILDNDRFLAPTGGR